MKNLLKFVFQNFGDKNLAEARTQKACERTPWKIKLTTQLTENQQIAFIFTLFTSAVCMNLRYMPYLLKKGE